MKEKIELEYTINSSPKVLFSRLSTPAGLAEWFADDVNVKGKIYTFIWDDVGQSAELVAKKENKYVKFRWQDEDPDTFFEFRITIDELTSDVALEITDFVDSEDINDTIELWNSQVAELKRAIGL